MFAIIIFINQKYISNINNNYITIIYLDKTLKRGISHATDNVNIVSQARSELIFIDSTEDELQIVETPIYTFILPDLSQLEGKI